MIQHPHILKNHIDHTSKRGPSPFFHSDTNLVLGTFLFHFVRNIQVLIVTVEWIWLLFLNILSLNFFQTSNKSLRFIKFISYVHPSVVVQTNHCQTYTAFFDWWALFKVAIFLLFRGRLSLMIVRLRNLFLLSIVVVKCCSLQGG